MTKAVAGDCGGRHRYNGLPSTVTLLVDRYWFCQTISLSCWYRRPEIGSNVLTAAAQRRGGGKKPSGCWWRQRVNIAWLAWPRSRGRWRNVTTRLGFIIANLCTAEVGWLWRHRWQTDALEKRQGGSGACMANRPHGDVMQTTPDRSYQPFLTKATVDMLLIIPPHYHLMKSYTVGIPADDSSSFSLILERCRNRTRHETIPIHPDLRPLSSSISRHSSDSDPHLADVGNNLNALTGCFQTTINRLQLISGYATSACVIRLTPANIPEPSFHLRT
mmetsp:Transcript_26242/g.63224  ORF Transcript_26242/g.63224 Transcript_26242/m.63224 type:complete len:275 (-) Transcript_26242:1938-2762(-)